MFSEVKISIFYEYTYQKLYGRPSKAWIMKNKKYLSSKKLKIYPMKSNGKKFQPLNLEKIKKISNHLKNNSTKHEFIELIIPEITQELKKKEFFCIEEEKPILKGFEGKSLFKKIKEVLTPFYCYQNKIYVNLLLIIEIKLIYRLVNESQFFIHKDYSHLCFVL